MQKKTRQQIILCLFGAFIGLITLTGRAEERGPAPAPQDTCPYTVKQGDTLIGIAQRLTGERENYRRIMQTNDLTSELIYPGRTLHISRELLLEKYQCAPPAVPTPTPTVLPTVTPTASPTLTPVPTLTPPPPESRKILAEIVGIVFIDLNENGRHDDDEAGLPDVKIGLVKGQVYQASSFGNTLHTDQDGKVVFAQIDPGQQALGLFEDTLPDGCRLYSESTAVISLAEGDRGFVTFAVRCEAQKSISTVPEEE